MYKKTCDRCIRASYSSSEFGKWICPSCYKDITHLKLRKPEVKKMEKVIPIYVEQLKQKKRKLRFLTYI
jgi:ribosomal protein L37AE/L43A